MILTFTVDHIPDIAQAQVLAWQAAFKGILSDQILSRLQVKEFEENWKRILPDVARKNYVWLHEEQKGVGFISFGPPKDSREIADMEIYGIYVHPHYWKQGIGQRLMAFAIHEIKTQYPSARIVLWTMKRNKLSKGFYLKLGFTHNGNSRVSKRYNETFEEVQFEQ